MPLVTTQNKLEVFNTELNLIVNPFVKNITVKILNEIPECFWEAPASSSGNYHPEYALGKGGLVRHTKACVAIAHTLFTLEMFRPLMEQKDLIVAALLLHDGLKNGWKSSHHTVVDHPVLMCDFIRKQIQPDSTDDEICQIDALSQMVLTHMGQWNMDYKTKRAIMPKPHSKLQNFVHLCDYLASRKILEFNFDEWPGRSRG